MSDIKIPSHCPVLGIPLFFGVRQRTDNSPSIDRIDNRRGYTKDNIAIISWRANFLKSNGFLEEFIALVIYIAEHAEKV